ncbi:hypothetical protein EGH24_04425 [Halonotius terrestris]|uniref:Uncharacterized protein n=1 Tax=Halonotius terrestris TaxID=2487750 RepID=A0A8J8P893_9EURY|nr:hypothetical protein [Halonotius terrestris]TQQ82700.1 hypothetical protein EGH24_04425 [Halonotius terrestris]
MQSSTAQDAVSAESAEPHSFSSKEQPKKVLTTVETERYGVRWKGKYGTWIEPDIVDAVDPYIYVHGPYCPHDGHGLRVGTVTKQVVRTDTAWICDACDRTYSYPEEGLSDESRIEYEMKQQLKKQRAQAQATD